MTVDGAVIQIVRRTTNISNLVVRQKIHLSRANGQVEFRALSAMWRSYNSTVGGNQINVLIRRPRYAD